MLRRLICAVGATVLASGLAVGTLGACSDDDGGCTYECDAEYSTQCSEQVIQTCRRNAEGCLTWVDTTDCQQWDQYCNVVGSIAQCTDDCIDLCTTTGSLRCSEDLLQVCALGTNGCLGWEDQTDCTFAGDVCEESGGSASCVQDCTGTPPGVPSGPTPADGAVDVDPNTVTSVDWADTTGANRYEAYFGPCPAPAWPAISYISVGSSERTELTAEEAQEYCWKVVAFNAEGCRTEGPEWSFTTSCTDPVAGAPTVRSGDQNFSPLTSGTYELSFSEPVQNVESSLTWTAVTGTGTMGTITAVDESTYNVSFSGVAPGDAYTLTVGTGVTDHCNTPLAAAVDIDLTVDEQHGAACNDPQNVTGASFPYGLVGTFDADVTGGSCETEATNTVFYTFTPTVTGLHRISASNATTSYAYSRLAVFQGTGCSPYGAEVACLTNSDQSISLDVDLTAGQAYLILFYTDGDSYTMDDPSLTIEVMVTKPGDRCSEPVDITSATFPYTLTGTFDFDPVGGSCDTTATNTVFFTYTPATSGAYRIDTVNQSTTNAYTRIAVYEGTGCSPYGTEMACQATSSTTGMAIVDLTGGTTYLIQVYTDGNTYTMVDPQISITSFSYGAGEACSVAQDITSASFPYTITGTFPYDFTGGSCDTTATNAVFYSYSPSATGSYRIDTVNATTTNAYTRIAVFAGTGCNPYGTEVACVTSSAKTAMAIVDMTLGTDYIIMVYTDGDSYTMVDPQITIAPFSYQAGESCTTAVDVSSVSFPHTLTGTFDYEFTGGSCDTTANNAVFYTYTPSTAGTYLISTTNATTTSAYMRVAVYQGTGCGPYGTQVTCTTSTSTAGSALVDLAAGTAYLIQVYTNGDTYTLVDPGITIATVTPQPGEACGTAVDLTSASFPHTLTGTFGYDFPGGSCDTDANNVVFYRYTAPTTGSYTIAATNATTTYAYARLAIFTTAACSPRGAEVACETSYATDITATVSLTAGTTYLLAFYTDGESYTMVDPQITITAP